MSAPRALFAAPAAHRATAEERGGAVEVALSQGAYVRLGADWVLLSEPSAPFGPLSIAVHGLRQLKLAPGAPARVSERRLLIGHSAISLERMRTRRAAPPAGAPQASADAIAATASALGAIAPLPRVLAPGLAALGRRSLQEAVRSLAGLGPGLTPAGDDVLAGYAACSNVLGGTRRPHRRSEDSADVSSLAAGRASPLGLAYLRRAEHGELADSPARLLAALHAGSAVAARAATLQLRAWGATSGTAIAWGMIAWCGGSGTNFGDSGPTGGPRSQKFAAQAIWRVPGPRAAVIPFNSPTST